MKKQIVMALALVAMLGTASTALINPNFTLIDMYNQSDQVLVLEFTEVTEDGKMLAKVTKVLKGDAAAAPKEITLDVMGLLAEFQQEAGRGVLNVVKSGYKTGVLFVGTFMIVSPDGHGGDPEERAILSLGHPPFSNFQWAVFLEEEGKYIMEKQPGPDLLATFAGSTDMVIKAIEYIRDDPDAEMPVDEGVFWDEEIKVGKVKGEAVAIMGVDVAGDGKLALFVASLEGDKLFRFNGKGFDDVTEAVGLTSKSRYVAWGDFNGDKRLDLASWNGKEIVIHAQQADGKFAPLPATTGEAIKDCRGLAVIDGDVKGRSSLVVSSSAATVLATLGQDDKWTTTALPTGEVDKLGEVASSFAVDLDGDGLTDILRIFDRGGMFYKGQGGGKFAEPVITNTGKGPGRYAVCLGDYDHDGLLDVFFTAEDRTRLYQNAGGGKFQELVGLSGEIPYISKPEGIACATGDFNNDGRQDIFIGYQRMAPQLFFNRGFRSFGHARDVDLSMQDQLQASHDGQLAGCLGDFNGSGALDMALALKDGDIWVVPRKMAGPGRSVSVALELDGAITGAVVVTAKYFDRSLGAMAVRPGEPVFFGASGPGAITLSWQVPGGERQTKEVAVENKPLRVVIGSK